MGTLELTKIVFPTDFSDVANNALHTVFSICERQRAELVLIHVTETQNFYMPPDAAGPVAESILRYEKDARAELEKIEQEVIGRFQFSVSIQLLNGDPAAEICKWATANHASMIVMGTHGASGLREFFIGSNAYRVVKHATCPVMTIPGANRWVEFKRVLFPIRPVPDALEKYESIRPIIKKNNAMLSVVGIIKKGDEQGAVLVKDLVASAVEKIALDEVRCTSEIHYPDDVAAHVLRLAEVEHPDLVVITATFEEQNAVKEFFIGPYTQQIVNHCRFPVLSIRNKSASIQ